MLPEEAAISLAWSAFEKLEATDGQPESDLAITQVIPPVEKKEKAKKEALLSTAENIESLNYRFAVDAISRKLAQLHLFLLKCHYGDCRNPFARAMELPEKHTPNVIKFRRRRHVHALHGTPRSSKLSLY